jgi:hypothetical protein
MLRHSCYGRGRVRRPCCRGQGACRSPAFPAPASGLTVALMNGRSDLAADVVLGTACDRARPSSGIAVPLSWSRCIAAKQCSNFMVEEPECTGARRARSARRLPAGMRATALTGLWSLAFYTQNASAERSMYILRSARIVQGAHLAEVAAQRHWSLDRVQPFPFNQWVWQTTQLQEPNRKH